jgi:hypothetical protein
MMLNAIARSDRPLFGIADLIAQITVSAFALRAASET